MSKKLTKNSVVISTSNATLNATQQLSEDWKNLLLSEQSADVTIRVGQKPFRAIKGILGARSPVFAAMFDHEKLKESETPNIDKMPRELLAVAEKYQVESLKNICEEVICKTIVLDNVASILVFSDRYNLEKLNQKCLEFMKRNLRAVMSNKTFQVQKKKYPEIFVGVLEHLLLL
ncbi:speckle-type POZ protein-like B [Aphidius gifuensis]|uniref:speckle-type POZ protein-like B n=1 Tax=Aphidius gifuensis TaxID=684658 RepID=UPI001CDB4EF5|nr:speckle-type POZ protein-like B [Aphidius gifuensis]